MLYVSRGVPLLFCHFVSYGEDKQKTDLFSTASLFLARSVSHLSTSELRDEEGLKQVLHFYFYIDTGWQIQVSEVFNRLRCRIDNVDQCSPSPSPCILTWDSDLNAALEWVFQNRANFQFAAVNLSLGGSGYEYTSQAQCDSERTSTKAAIDNLRSARIATIVSSGNDGFSNGLSEPACISSAISVGATTKTDQYQ